MTPLTVTMIDYGAGNLSSVIKGFEAAGATVRLAQRPEDLAAASAIVVPGVGHFEATRSLDDAWRAAIVSANRHGTPLFGICLGMQWLFEGSEEAPDVPGLGLLEGRCARIPDNVKVPHVGWNQLEFVGKHARLLEGLESGIYAYFTHTYAAPVVDGVVAATVYGERFAAVVEHRRVYGVQFHPEKSGRTGLRMLQNFVRLAGGGV